MKKRNMNYENWTLSSGWTRSKGVPNEAFVEDDVVGQPAPLPTPSAVKVKTLLHLLDRTCIFLAKRH